MFEIFLLKLALMDQLHYRQKFFKTIEIVEFVSIARKTVSKLVKLKILIAKCCKM